MPRSGLKTIFGILTLLLSSHGTAESLVPIPAPLFVLISGYWSCGENGKSTDGMNLSGQFDRYFSSLSKDHGSGLKTPTWLKICLKGNFFGSDNYGQNIIFSTFQGLQDKPLPPLPLYRYKPFADQEDENAVAKALVLHDGIAADDIESWLRPLTVQIDKLSIQGRRPIIVIGHSFGAWISMRLSLMLLDEGLPIKALFTLDAISRLECSPQLVIVSYFGIPFVHQATPDKRCTRFPADIDENLQTRLRESVGSWINLYQTQFGYLHSGQTADSGKEEQFFDDFTAEELKDNFSGGHTAMAESEKLWDIIRIHVNP